MATRKGKGRQAVRNGRKGFPIWGYIAIGILLGGVLMIFMMRGSLMTSLRKPAGPRANPQATAQQGSSLGVLEPAASGSAAKKPQYDFYSVLSEKEVRIPDAEISAQAHAEQQQKQLAAQQQAQQQQSAAANLPAVDRVNITAAPASAMTPSSGSGYLLQVGAFPNAADAETLKAKLALQGFVAKVQSVNIGGQVFHRVRLGPFRSATQLESTKQQLASAGIKAIALKEGN
ncbi:MAG: SPOR domain-containing protein [Rhodanobacter sp.]|nr:MAG: SPOR domain-containing protein [Rhodanobacter sp.]